MAIELRKTGPKTPEEKSEFKAEIRAYQESVPRMKIDGIAGNQTAGHMMDTIAEMRRHLKAAKLVAGVAILCVGLALWLGMGW